MTAPILFMKYSYLPIITLLFHTLYCWFCTEQFIRIVDSPIHAPLKRWGFYDTTGMNLYFSQFGYQRNVIVVYPHANREFNWMFPDDGFHMVLDIVKDIKRYFNIDDNKVFISGHSNGATGVMSYLLKSPSFFAGFYGFNSNPRIHTGGTFIKNALNRSYFNVATDKDYYFPLSGHDTLERIAKSYGIDWQNHVYHGFPHWFPQFKESYGAFKLIIPL